MTEATAERIDIKDAIAEAAAEMKKRIKALPFGIKVGTVHHSPVSNSIYYEIFHEELNGCRPETIRISDHELQRQTVYMFADIVVGKNGSYLGTVEAQIAAATADLTFELE